MSAPFSLHVLVDALRAAGELVTVEGTLPEIGTGISDDSRGISPGGVFMAVRGSAGDGHDYLAAAQAGGATAAIVEDAGRTMLPRRNPATRVSTRRASGSDERSGNPSSTVRVGSPPVCESTYRIFNILGVMP